MEMISVRFNKEKQRIKIFTNPLFKNTLVQSSRLQSEAAYINVVLAECNA